MDPFETAVLDAADEAKWWGVGVAVITRPGRREWRFTHRTLARSCKSSVQRYEASHNIRSQSKRTATKIGLGLTNCGELCRCWSAITRLGNINADALT